ncbi:hypothetical protein BC826DRAFT_975463 [Russula brevipes]|nr:hypothetical protein BC826DRAFT_975463 [Russula brevipes]
MTRSTSTLTVFNHSTQPAFTQLKNGRRRGCCFAIRGRPRKRICGVPRRPEMESAGRLGVGDRASGGSSPPKLNANLDGPAGDEAAARDVSREKSEACAIQTGLVGRGSYVCLSEESDVIHRNVDVYNSKKSLRNVKPCHETLDRHKRVGRQHGLLTVIPHSVRMHNHRHSGQVANSRGGVRRSVLGRRYRKSAGRLSAHLHGPDILQYSGFQRAPFGAQSS